MIQERGKLLLEPRRKLEDPVRRKAPRRISDTASILAKGKPFPRPYQSEWFLMGWQPSAPLVSIATNQKNQAVEMIHPRQTVTPRIPCIYHRLLIKSSMKRRFDSSPTLQLLCRQAAQCHRASEYSPRFTRVNSRTSGNSLDSKIRFSTR